ncbi:MAG TPA: iron-sulfur cluster assembly accessory protein [Edaphocola sp.]|nr:iron-sulfur cluster assembly accessory protein [Edaphocola sp.]
MSQVLEKNPVSFTPNALKELKNVLAAATGKETMLRIGVKGGGCSGLSYVLGMDQKGDEDMEYRIQGLPVIMNKAHAIYLLGMQIDYGDGLNARGFIFENPNASSTCGCGTSFAV